MNSGQTVGGATLLNSEKVSLGTCCYKNSVTPADPTVSGPQPLCTGNYESLKLSSPRGSSNRVSHSFNSRRETERPGSAGILPASAGCRVGDATPLPRLQRLPLWYQRSRACMAGLFQGV